MTLRAKGGSSILSLFSFSPTPSAIKVEGDVRRESKALMFKFRLHDPDQQIVGSPSTAQWNTKQLERADGLWQFTCLEAFWAKPGEKSYYELNLSPNSPRWNLYSFNSYRQPQPPHPSDDFNLEFVQTRPDAIECRLTSTTELPKLEFSLTAIIKTEQETLYFATHQATTKPDFHARESFTIAR